MTRSLDPVPTPRGFEGFEGTRVMVTDLVVITTINTRAA